MLEYKFYKALVTGGGYRPQGDCQATLELDENRNPTWSDMSDEFKELCLPWFGQSVMMSVWDNAQPMKPYSDEALEHLAKHQLPSQGFVMMTIKGPPPKRAVSAPVEEKPADTPPSPPPAFNQQFFIKPQITHKNLNEIQKRKKVDSDQD